MSRELIFIVALVNFAAGSAIAAPYRAPAKPAVATASKPIASTASKPVTSTTSKIVSILSKAQAYKLNMPIAPTASKPVMSTGSKPIVSSTSNTITNRPSSNTKYGSCGNSPCTSLNQADMRINNPALMQKYSAPVRSSHSANDCKPVCKGNITVGGLSIMDPRAQAYMQPAKKLRTMAINGKTVQFWE